MNIGDLQEIIKDLPKDMEIGGRGHFGEFLDCVDIRPTIVRKSQEDIIEKNILQIDIESPGEEPC